MHIISVVTLLVGSMAAYTMAAPQLGGGFYPGNIAGLSIALAQLAQQLAQQNRNNTLSVGNSSSIVSGVSSSIANANIGGDRNPGWGNGGGWGHGGGWNNGGWGNGGWGNGGWGNGYWRGVPEEDISADDAEYDEDYQNAEDEIDSKEEF